jgi:hypothetical protein
VASERYAELERRYQALERWREAATSDRQSIEFELLLADTLYEQTKLLLTKAEIAEIEGNLANMQTPPGERAALLWRRHSG